MSQACEWKSNLFVPKSNDILFAQSAQLGDVPQASGRPQQQQQQAAPTSHSGQLQLAASSAPISLELRRRARRLPRQTQAPTGADEAQNVIMQTSSKALVLALWPPGQPTPQANFNGFEQGKCGRQSLAPSHFRRGPLLGDGRAELL